MGISKYCKEIQEKRLRETTGKKKMQLEYVKLVKQIEEIYGTNSLNKNNWEKLHKRMSDCCTSPVHAHNDKTGRSRVISVNSCGNKMCPLCTGKVIKIKARTLEVILKRIYLQGYKFKMLTLTVKNVFGIKECRRVVKEMNRIFTNLLKRPFMVDVKGYFNKFECTNTIERGLHPHFHTILTVKQGTGRVEYKEIKNYWITELAKVGITSKIMELVDLGTPTGKILPNGRPEYKTITNGNDLKKAIAYATKYAVKIACVVKDKKGKIKYTPEEQVRLYWELAEVMYRQKDYTYGGIFKELLKELKEKELKELKSNAPIDEKGQFLPEEEETEVDYYSISSWNIKELKYEIQFIIKDKEALEIFLSAKRRCKKARAKIKYHQQNILSGTDKNYTKRSAQNIIKFWQEVGSLELDNIQSLILENRVEKKF